MRPMMKCGHAANAISRRGDVEIPCCAICAGLGDRGGMEIDENPPNLTGRKARCSCFKTEPSGTNLAFFEHRPESQFDSYYCGCNGWD